MEMVFGAKSHGAAPWEIESRTSGRTNPKSPATPVRSNPRESSTRSFASGARAWEYLGSATERSLPASSRHLRYPKGRGTKRAVIGIRGPREGHRARGVRGDVCSR